MDPKLIVWSVSYYFGAFGTVWLPYETRCKTVQTISCHEVALEIFATKAPDPPHWTLNKCFGAFRTIWVHLGLFGCLTKLGAKWAELVQNLVPRSYDGIFRNECTRSAPIRTICVHSGPFGCLTKLGAKRDEQMQKFVPRSPVGIFSQPTHPIRPIGP